MADKNLELKITADGRQAQSSLRALADELDRLAKGVGGAAQPALAGMAEELRKVEAEGVDAGAALAKLGGARGTIKLLADDLERAAASAGGELKPALEQAAAQLRALGASYGKTGADAAASADKQVAAGNRVSGVWDRVKAGLASFTPAVVLGNLITNLVNRIGQMGRAFIEANVQIESTRRALNAIYKDAALTEKQIGFLRDVSNTAGVGFEGLSNAFKSFTASATAANIPLAVQNDLFRSVAQAGATLGLSTAESARALTALSQMASKGTVSMEELRQQLGETLPGALSLTAKGLGLTEQELIKLVESGGLAARDLFPALAQSLKSMAGENDTLQGSWSRLGNAITQLYTSIGDGGGVRVLTGALRLLAGALGVILVPIQGFAETLFGLGRAAGAAAASVAILADTSLSWKQKAAALKKVGSDLRDSFAAAGGRIDATRKAFQGAATGADDAAGAMGKSANAANASTESAAALSRAWVQVGNELTKAAADTALAVDTSTKHAQAVKSQGDALIVLARVQGDANTVTAAESQAAAANALALQQVADARASALKVAQDELAQKQQLIAGSASEQQARANDIKTLQDHVVALTADAAAAKEQAQVAQNAALAAQAGAAARADNSARVAEFASTLADATRTYKLMVQAQQEGLASDEDVTKAKRAQALAQSQYNDALSDSVDKARASAISKKADFDASISLLQTQKALAGQSEQMARLMGNEEAARNFRIQQLRIDIQITHAKADAMRAEAEGAIAVANATLAAMRASGEINQVKEAELNASIKVAEAKLKEADAIRESSKLIEKAAQNLRDFGDEAGRAGHAGKNAGDQVAASWGNAASAIEGAAHRSQNAARVLSEADKKVLADMDERYSGNKGKYDPVNPDKYGRPQWKGSSAGRPAGGAMSPTMLGNSWLSIYNQVKGLGASEADARRIADSMFDARGKYVGQAQQRFGETAGAAAQRLAGEAIRFGGSPPAAAPAQPVQLPSRFGNGGAGGGQSFVSNITIPGLGTTRAGFADRQSQDNVTNLLKRLASDKARAQ